MKMICKSTPAVIYTRNIATREAHDDDKVGKIDITALSTANARRTISMSHGTARSHNKPTVDELLHQMPAAVPAMRRQ